MPNQPTTTDIHLSNIITCITSMLPLLNDINDGFGTPFIQAISNTTFSVIAAAQVMNSTWKILPISYDSQNVKRNKDECIRLMENIHAILYAITNLHIKSETVGSLPPAITDHIGKFTETLHKIHTFVQAQQDGSKIKYFFRQNEMNTLCKDCHLGLDEALKVFKVETGLIIANNMVEVQKKTQSMHQELLDLVETLSDCSTSDKSSSPQIFHGRQSELKDIVMSLGQPSAHIAILGAGGIGKTSLARAVLHDPQIAAKYEYRLFVAADSATTSIELAALTGSHLGLKPGKDLTKAVVQFLSRGPPCLLILDNLETPWEPLKSRDAVEEFLSLLTDIPHLALIITMRGAERPAKTFIEIADNFHDPEDIDQLLQLTDNMPLAVDLIAHLVDYEGCSNVLVCWKTEKTSLLSSGYDKWSSLDISITISLASPRMTPGAKNLLSLLSILPDGLSDTELVQSDLPIQHVLGCKATLLRTSLAYSDDKQRLKSLVPIREHVRSSSPPSQSLFHPLCKYFHLVMGLYENYWGLHQNNTRVDQIKSNLGNLHQLLLLELHLDNPDIRDAINCTLSLNSFHRLTSRGQTQLIDHIPSVLPQPCDHQIEAKYVTEMLRTTGSVEPQALINRGIAHFHQINNPVLEARFYIAVGNCSQYSNGDFNILRQSYEKALSLAKFCGDSRQHAVALGHLAQLKFYMGDYSAAQMHAREAQEIAQLSGNLYQEALILLIDANVSAQEDPVTNAVALLNIAELDVMIGVETLKVQHNLDNAKTILSTLGRAGPVVQCGAVLADLHLREGDEMVAKTLFHKCLDPVRRNDYETISYCLERLADIGRWSSTNNNGLYRWPVIYLLHTHKTQEKVAFHRALCCLGDVFLSEGDEYTAHNLFVVALEGFTDMDVHRSRADCMLRLGDIAKHRGYLVKALNFWKVAGPLFERSLQMKDVAQINTRLASVSQTLQDTPESTCKSE
ncbi:hypothetical protein C8R44DRAFT_731450 [Mycena epipterygia]|nr:hypothetical protein C8R44DRAFT_731450 [Mycena epipterygia]